MHYVSTRNSALRYTAAQAIAQGLSRDGGLFTPAQLPRLPEDWLERLLPMDYPRRAAWVMGLFLEDFSPEELETYARRAYGDGFDDPRVAPLRQVEEGTYCLELWHGPTSAFKDMALQMLPHLLTASLRKTEEERTACILVATSGDTGKAALEGFCDVEGTRILVFYPRDGVSEIQALQMRTQAGGNVGVCAVAGNFDDAQTGVKQLFSDPALRAELDRRGYFFSSANSINWGRVLPQIVYYISAYCDLVSVGGVAQGGAMNVCVPTGNFGNILAAYYAGKMGVPVGKLICASNRNNVLTDFLTTGVYDRNRPFYSTTSPSMDILISSNLERLLFDLTGQDDARVRAYMSALNSQGRYEVDGALKAALAARFAAGCCDEVQTAQAIRAMWEKRRYLIDPHTAVAFHVLEEYRAATGDRTATVVASTASPFKFCDSVLTALGETELADGLALLEQLERRTDCPAPAPLAGLRGRAPRFDQWVEKEAMEQVVLAFLPS